MMSLLNPRAMQDYTKLEVWHRAHRLVLQLYAHTEKFPSDERYGLTAQLRRSASSVATNIAEGCGGRSRANLARFVDISCSSASEVEYQLHLARDLHYVTNAVYTELAAEISSIRRMLTRFRQAVIRADKH